MTTLTNIVTCIRVTRWLLADPDMQVRTNYPGYLDAARRYLHEVLSRVVDLQVRSYLVLM